MGFETLSSTGLFRLTVSGVPDRERSFFFAILNDVEGPETLANTVFLQSFNIFNISIYFELN